MSRCDHWFSRGLRCDRGAAFRLFGAGGRAVPIGPVCEPCARAIVHEYAEKLGWHWTLEPVRGES